MNSSKVIERFSRLYPGKEVIVLPPGNPTEILCEVDPSSGHPEYSIAVSIIDRSAPHYHKKSTETYKVLEGELKLFIDGVDHHLKNGESMTIKPFCHHYAIGKETLIECRSEPGWTHRDHILVSEK